VEKKVQTTNRVKNPGKQRKRLYNAPAHVRHKLMAAPLSKELAASKGVKTLPVRKGDTVHIQRGDNKGFEGKISRVDLRNYRIYLEGLTREKVDGTNIFVAVHPSKVMIRSLNLDDNRRKAVIARKKPIEKPETKAAAKPAKKQVAEKPAKPQPKVEEVKETPVEAPPVEEAAPEIAEVEAPAAKEEIEEAAPAKEPAPKKAAAKKPAAKKPAAKVTAKKAEAPAPAAVKEKAPAKKEVKPKAAAKKAPAAKEAASKSRAKPKTSKKTEGGQ
jgi:large subunit ribosomal protein L24